MVNVSLLVTPAGAENRPISSDVRFFVDLYFNGFLLTCLSIFGMATNAINIVVFIKHGLNDTGVLPLFALSISDLGHLIFLTIFGVSSLFKCLCPGLMVDPNSIAIVVASWPRTMFVDISVLITMFISVERSLCVALPFMFRGVLKTSRIIVILFSFFFIGIACYLPIFSTLSLRWKTDQVLNTTRLLFHMGEHYSQAEVAVSVFNSVTLTTLSQITVMTSALILIVCLKRSSQFQSRSQYKTISLTSNVPLRNKNLARLVLVISVMFVVCNSPTVVTVYAIMLMPEFQTVRNYYEHVSFLFFCFVFFFGALHASVNIFIYYKLSSKYRLCLCKLFHI